MLRMGPVTIAVDSYGPVTDNAQSVYELSLIEENKMKKEVQIEKISGFKPDWEKAKLYLEEKWRCREYISKATAKPVLIGTEEGATTMIFSLILVLKMYWVEPETILNLLNPYSILGFLCGGAQIYWFYWANTGSHYRSIQCCWIHKKNINLDEDASLSASTEKVKRSCGDLYKICTERNVQYFHCNIFFCDCIFIHVSSSAKDNSPAAFFISYLISIGGLRIISGNIHG